MPYDFKVADVTPGREGGKRLSIVWTSPYGEVAEATNVEFKTSELGVVEGHVALRDLGANDVQEFLQGALEAAWAMGMRPKDFGLETVSSALIQRLRQDVDVIKDVVERFVEGRQRTAA